MKSITGTYKGDLRDFKTPLNIPFFKIRIRKFLSDKKEFVMILGESGTGKTFLASCLAGEKSNRTIRIITCEYFVSQIVKFITSNKDMNVFIEELINFDVIILDEIEGLDGKEITQEKVAEVLRSLIDRGIKIILLGLPEKKRYEKLLEILKKDFDKNITIMYLPKLSELERRKYITQKANELNIRLSRLEIRKIAMEDMRVIIGILNSLAVFSGGEYTNEDVLKNRIHGKEYL